MHRTLNTFIEPANLPKKYGGQLDWAIGQPPALDPAEETHITWANADSVQKGWPLGPMKWVPAENGTLVGMAVGSVDGKERREIVATLHPESADHRKEKARMGRLSVQGERVVVNGVAEKGEGAMKTVEEGMQDLKLGTSPSANGAVAHGSLGAVGDGAMPGTGKMESTPGEYLVTST